MHFYFSKQKNRFLVKVFIYSKNFSYYGIILCLIKRNRFYIL
ncbi:hypothetical protein CUZ96_1485 [Enterococcus lactis]|nr:hypothetical protein [Enterococcus lactis]